MRFTASLPLPAEACVKLRELASDPRSVFAWLREGDPLELQPRVAHHVRAGAYLIDIERVTEKVMINMAREASIFTSDQDLNTWLEDRVKRLCVAFLEHDAMQFAQNKDWQEPFVKDFSLMLALPPDVVVKRLIDFHRQDFKVRQAFFELLINGKKPLQCLVEGLGPPWLLRERCLRGMKALYLSDEEKANGAEGW